MTAIAGVASSRALPYSETQVRKLLSEQRVYGSERVALASAGSATFGISPRSGAFVAPAVANSHVMLVADGRLDNRDELAERVGRRSRGQSDSDLLLAAWLKAGEDCLSWLVGDFALAVYDARTRLLTLARDPTGQVPLHYAQVGEDLAFASMPSGLRPILGRLEVDRTVVAAALGSLRDQDPRSAFNDVARVLPGEVVRLGTEGPRRHIYWAPTTIYDEPFKSLDLVEEYRHVLDVAVADCLKGSSGPIATHLSSGYDSSAVTATAARLVRDPSEIIAFTSAPVVPAPVPVHHWRIGDESEIAAATAGGLGIRHVVVRDVPSMREVMRGQFLLSQEPNISVPNLAWLLQIRREAAALGADRLLNGESGNVTLHTGGLYILTEWVRLGRWLTWARQARHAAARPDTHWRGVLFNSFLPWIPKRAADSLRRLRFGSASAREDPFIRPEWREKALNSAIPEPSHANGYDARIYWIRTGNPGMLRKAGLAGEGIEERDPLADRRVIEFSLKIPPEQFYWNGVPRPLAREALADRLPKSVIDLNVRGLQAADWAVRFTQADASAILDEISQSSTAHELFDLERMKRAIDTWPTEDWNDWRVQHLYRGSLMGALSGGMFALVHEQGASPASEGF